MSSTRYETEKYRISESNPNEFLVWVKTTTPIGHFESLMTTGQNARTWKTIEGAKRFCEKRWPNVTN